MLYLFNTTIMPNAGENGEAAVFSNRKVSTEQVASILFQEAEYGTIPNHYEARPFVSALGHQGSADAFNACFPGLNCTTNRIQATMQPNDEAIALKVWGRLPEGQIFTLDELERVGYEFYHIVRTA